MPLFSAFLGLPNLAGKLSVLDAGGTRVAEVDARIGDGTFEADLPELPAGRDLFLGLDWFSGETWVATAAPKAFRVEVGQRADMQFQAGDYAYPDEDGDGAASITEVRADANTAADPAAVPPGFFNRVGPYKRTANPPGYWAVDVAPDGEVLVATQRVSGSGSALRFSNHALEGFRSPYSAPGRSLPLASCPDIIVSDLHFDAQTEAAYVSCGSTVSRVGTPVGGAGFGTARSITLPARSPTVLSNLVYSTLGSVLYVSTSEPSVYMVCNAGVDFASGPHARYSNPTVIPYMLADTGLRVVVANQNEDNLVVLSRNASCEFVPGERILGGAFRSPADVKLHPSFRRLYVSNLGDASITVVDCSAEDPGAWQVVDRIALAEGAQLSVSLALDPDGNWLYATTDTSLFRIGTLTNQVEREWQVAPAGSGRSVDVVRLSGRGGFGLVKDTRGFYPLAFEPP